METAGQLVRWRWWFFPGWGLTLKHGNLQSEICLLYQLLIVLYIFYNRMWWVWRNQILGYVLWGVLNEYISKAKGVREVRERLFIPLGISGRNHGNWHKHIGRVVVLVKETHESGGEYARRLSTFEVYALRTIVILRNIHAVGHGRCSWSAGMRRSCYIHCFLSQRLMWDRRWFEELGLLQPAG